MIHFLLQDVATGASMSSSLLMFALIIVVFYFFMLRPQQQKQKKAQQFRDNLKVGQNIVTIGGIHGKILNIDEKTVLIQSEGQTKIRLERIAISTDGNKDLSADIKLENA